MNNTSTVANLIDSAILETEPRAGAKHIETLVGEREAGSKWGCEMTLDMMRSLPWQKVAPSGPDMLPFCTYLRLDAESMGQHFPNARQNCEPASTLDPSTIKVRVQTESHTNASNNTGIRVHELVSSEVKERACSEAWLIIGPASKEDPTLIVWTLFPGELFGRLDPQWDGDLSKIDLKSAVPVKGV